MFGDKSQTSTPVEFIRWSGGENKVLVGNRIQLEDAQGNALSNNGSLNITSSDIVALLNQIKALLQGTLNVANLQPNVFKSVDALAVSSEATVWTPASGKKFRLMGGIFSIIGAAGNVALKDGSSGSTIWILPNVVIGTPIYFTLGDGILSTAANNLLRASGAALQVLNGTVWGREE